MISIRKPLAALSLLFICQSQLWADSLRDRASKLIEAKPFMGTFADFTMTSLPEDQEDAKEWDQEKRQQIAEIETALKANLPKTTRFDFHEKLAELYLAREVFLRRSIEAGYVQRWDAFARGALAEEPVINLKPAQDQLFKAVNHLRVMVRDHSKHPRLDRAVYELARNLCRIGNENHVFYFSQFKRRFPKSSYDLQAKAAMADCLYDAGKLQEASNAYNEVLAAKQEPWRSYASYRKAWVFLSQAEGKQGNERLQALTLGEKALVATISRSRDDSEDRVFSVHEEAFSDIVWVYALLQQESLAKKFLTDRGRKDLLPEYDYHLGRGLFQLKKFTESILYFQKIASNDQSYRRLPEVLRLQAEAHSQLGQFEQLIKTLNALVKVHDEDSDFMDAHDDDPAYVKEAMAQSEFFIRDLALRFNDAGESQQNRNFLLVAEAAYKAYLSFFQETEAAYDLSFYLATLLFKRQAFGPAAQQFTKVFQMKEEGGSHRRDAAFNAVLSWSNLDDQTKYKSVPHLGMVKDELEIPVVKSKLIEAIDRFAQAFPNDEARMPMSFTKAQVLMEYGHYEESIETFETIATNNPESEYGVNAIQTIFSMYAGRSDWGTVRAKALEYLENPRLVQPQMQKLITATLNQAETNLRVSQSGKEK